MKKSLILFSLLLSLGALADATVEESNFAIKGLNAIQKKCHNHRPISLEEYNQQVAEFEATKADCEMVEQILAKRAAAKPEVVAHNVLPKDDTAPVAPAADLPKDEI